MIPADAALDAQIAKNPDSPAHISYFLMASWLYYHADTSLLSDERYDRLAREIDEKWDRLHHRHKVVIDREGLRAGTQYAVPDEAYPMRVVHAACHLAGIPQPPLIERRTYELPRARVRVRNAAVQPVATEAA